MTPPPLSRIQRNTGSVVEKVPLRCTLMTLSQSDSLALAKVWSRRMPALLTRMSARPKCLMASSNTDWPPSRVAMAAPFATARPPSALIASTTLSAIDLSAPEPSRGPPRSLTTTAAPSRANSLAYASPSPPPAPVISATLPSSSPMPSSRYYYFPSFRGASERRTRNLEILRCATAHHSSRFACPGMTSLAQHRHAVLDHGDAPRLHFGLEGDHLAVLPHLQSHGLAGIDRRGKPRRVALEGGWVVIGIGLQDPAAGDAVGAHAVQDRSRKTGALGEFRIGVQRVAVAAETVDQRLVRPRRNVDGPVGCAGRHRMRLGLAFRRPAKAAVAARKARGDQRRQRLSIAVLEHGLVPDHRALVLALVERREHGGVCGNVSGGRQRLVEGDVALAVNHHHAVEIHLAGSRAPGGHGREGRHHLQRPRGGSGLVDEGELLLGHGISAQADAIGIEHHLAIAVAVFLAKVLHGHQLFVFDRHFLAAPPGLLCVGGAASLRGREERQGCAFGRLEHDLYLLADLQFVDVAVDEVGLQRRTFLQRDIADRVRPGRRFTHQAEGVDRPL